MTVPLIVLAVLSTVGGLLGVSYALGSMFSDHPVNYIERTLEPVISHVPETAQGSESSHEPAPPSAAEQHGAESTAPTVHEHSPEEIRAERLLALLSVLIAAAGIGIGWLIFQRRPLLKMPRVLENGYYVDEAYNAAVINPIKSGSRQVLWKLFDVGVIDGFLHSLGDVIKEAGGVIRRLQAGFVRGYAAIILIGALALIAFFAYYGVQVLKSAP
jgi:NADH-quinone oxidoreductase subunit L